MHQQHRTISHSMRRHLSIKTWRLHSINFLFSLESQRKMHTQKKKQRDRRDSASDFFFLFACRKLSRARCTSFFFFVFICCTNNCDMIKRDLLSIISFSSIAHISLSRWDFHTARLGLSRRNLKGDNRSSRGTFNEQKLTCV